MLKAKYPIIELCRTLKCSKSGYSDWIKLGGSNLSYEDASQLLYEMYQIISSHYMVESDEYEAVMAWYTEDSFARKYAAAYEKNTEEISQKVKELALEITKDCTYEWEKAEALEDYLKDENL